MTAQLRVLSIYEGFFSGGARILHSDLLSGLHGRRGQQHSLLSIHQEMHREATLQPMQHDACYRRLVADGVSVATLGRGARDRADYSAAELAQVSGLVSRADVVVTLKEQPLALLNRAELHGRPVIACLHRSDPDNQGGALAELRGAAASGRLAAAVCCAESARTAYLAAGIPAELLHVIPNGVDLRRFRPSGRARAAVRAEFGIPEHAPTVVFAARYDAMKNVPLFLAAASRLLALRPNAHVLLCGAGMTAANPALLWDLAACGLAATPGRSQGTATPGAGRDRPAPDARIHLLGVREDPEAVFAAADVVALTSAFGEAAPLCLIEGLLCGAVPVATDVGDCAAIVDGHGLIAAPEPEALAAAWLEALARRPQFLQLSRHTRHRFGRARMIGAYGALIRRTHRIASRATPLSKGSVTLPAAVHAGPPPAVRGVLPVA
jgi:glycosyltransferase involved in cell wall biosynthesis